MSPAVTSRPRRADRADLARARELIASAGLPLAGVDEHFERFWVVDAPDGRLAAVAGAESYGRTWLLRSVVVDRAYRDRGIGSALLAAVLDEARRLSAQEVFLLTTDSRDFFAARGFSELPRAAAPNALQASAELRGACPDTAALMRLELAR